MRVVGRVRMGIKVVTWKEWMANSRARAAIVFSPPERLDIGWKRFPGATQL